MNLDLFETAFTLTQIGLLSTRNHGICSPKQHLCLTPRSDESRWKKCGFQGVEVAWNVLVLCNLQIIISRAAFEEFVDIMRLCNVTVEEKEGLIKERLRWGGVWRRGRGCFLVLWKRLLVPSLWCGYYSLSFQSSQSVLRHLVIAAVRNCPPTPPLI